MVGEFFYILEQMDLQEICIGAAGLILVSNGIVTLLSPKYYELFSCTFFIEKMSDVDRQRVNQKIKSDHTQSRYVVSAFVIFFGLTAIAWAIGYKAALGWPFNLLF